MITTVKLTPRGTVTLPRAFRRQFVLKANDLLIAETTDFGILLRPASILPTEMYSEKRIAEFEDQNNRAIAEFFPDRRKRDN
jgi:bifunctional DNA-binding transcriptional regulator/antitoxin component of YhaV-PrlF toxin-antitoxin module